MTWLVSPPDQSLALLLADNGFDVWITSTRGTKYSRGHTSLTTDDAVSFLSADQYMFLLSQNLILSYEDFCLLFLGRLIGIGHGMNW